MLVSAASLIRWKTLLWIALATSSVLHRMHRQEGCKLSRFLLMLGRDSKNEKPTQRLQPSWPLTGVIRALRARNPKKSKKSCRGLSAPGSKKVEKKSKKGQKRVKNDLFSTFSTFFQLFFNLFGPRGREAPATFFRLFWDFGPEGPE